MIFAVLGLPRSHHLKLFILNQFARVDHEFVVVDERRQEFIDGGWSQVTDGANTTVLLLDSFSEHVLTKTMRKHNIDRIMSLSDRSSRMAARLRARCGLPGMTEHAESLVVDKGLMRERLLELGLSTVTTQRTTLDRLVADTAGRSFPYVVKPASLGASLCVQLIRRPNDLPGYIARCRANRVFDDDALVVEDYVPGPELSVEGVVASGRITFFGVTESHHSGEPHFVGTGHDFFPAHARAAEISEFVRKVIGALEMDDSLFHIELKVLPTGFEVIEAHTRFGGNLIAELVRLGTGMEVFSAYARAMAGEPVPMPVPRGTGIYGQHMLCSRPGRISALALAEWVTADERVLAHSLDHAPGDAVEADFLPVEYVGHVLFTAADRAEAAEIRMSCERGLTLQLADEPTIEAEV